MDDEVLAVVAASPLRRWMGIGTLVGVAVFALWILLAGTAALSWQLFLLAIGAGALWMAERMRRATEAHLELTASELRTSTGQTVARVEDIEAVERGAFAFKPSNGFLVRTRTPADRVWQPGLWWRMGRRIGIGGVTPGHQSKQMADIIAALLLERRKGPE